MLFPFSKVIGLLKKRVKGRISTRRNFRYKKLTKRWKAKVNYVPHPQNRVIAHAYL